MKFQIIFVCLQNIIWNFFMNCTIHKTEFGKIVSVTTKDGQESQLFSSAARTMAYNTLEEAVEVISAQENLSKSISNAPQDLYSNGEPKLFYRTPEGITTSYKEALTKAKGEPITLGFKGSTTDFISIRELSSTLDNNTPVGVINNAIVNDNLQEAKVYHEGSYSWTGIGNPYEAIVGAKNVFAELNNLSDNEYTINGEGLISLPIEEVQLPESKGGDLQLINSLTGTGASTQEFFGNVVTGGDARYEPSKPYEYEEDFSGSERAFQDRYDQKMGNFDQHIATSIPTFRETQIKKGAAIVRLFKKAPEVINNALKALKDTYQEITGIKSSPTFIPVDSKKFKELAEYHTSVSDDRNNEVMKRSYRKFLDETLQQFNYLLSKGYDLRPYLGKGEPYGVNSNLIREDLKNNNRLFYLMSRSATGEGNENESSENYMPFEETGIVIDGQPVLYNDAFRAVHDVFGHGMVNNSFSAQGELDAYQTHKTMYSKEAQKALFLETVMYNAYYQSNKKYAPRKIYDVPQEFMDFFDEGPVVYDLGGSEGSWVKTITEESNGNIKTINLDPSPEMQASFNRNKPENSEMSLEAFYQGWDNVKTHQPKEKADIVHESMMFQFIDNNGERADYIKEVKDKYLKENGLFITEEKFQMNSPSEYQANEELKVPHKDKYYTKEQQSLKADQVLVGMKENQANYSQYLSELKEQFKYVQPYWFSGNFRGIVATDNKEMLDKFLKELGTTSNPKYTFSPTITSNSNGIDLQNQREKFNRELQEIENKTKRDGTFMLAPNGKKTNLSEREWLITRHPNFINWFGDFINDPQTASKVVDKNGDPRKVYHGSKTMGFHKFDISDVRDGGHFFAGDIQMASTYSPKNDSTEYNVVSTNAEALKLFEDNDWSVESILYVGNNRYDTLEEALEDNEGLSEEDIEKEFNIYNSDGDLMDTSDSLIHSANTAEFMSPGVGSFFLNLRDPGLIDGYGDNWDDIRGVKAADLTIQLELDVETDNYKLMEFNGDNVSFSTLEEAHSYVEDTYGEEAADGLIDTYEDEGFGYHHYSGDPRTGEEAPYGQTTREWVDEVKNWDTDGVIFNDIDDNGPHGYSGSGDVFVVFNSEDIKSTDNLGQFDPKNEDIRFSVDGEGRNIPTNQSEIENVLAPITEVMGQSVSADSVNILNTEEIAEVLKYIGANSYSKDIKVKGFVHDNKVYLNSDLMTLDTPFHEIGHIWLNSTKKNNPELFKRGIALMKSEGKVYTDYVKKTQPNLKGAEILEEALAQAIGENGAQLLKENKKSNFKQWLSAFFNWIAGQVGISEYVEKGELGNLTLEQFSTAVAIELLKSKNSPAADLVVTKTFGDDKTKITSNFIEEQKLPQYIKEGRIKVHTDVSFMEGADVFFAGPDDTLVGNISFDFGNKGVKTVEGDGGLYFPLSFEDIWAFKNNANGTSFTVRDKLNQLYERNKSRGIDKTYVVLVKGSEYKGISNPQGMETAFRVLEGLSNSEIITEDLIKQSLSSAIPQANLEYKKALLTKRNGALKRAGKPIKTLSDVSNSFELNFTINNEKTIEELKDELINFFKDEATVPFETRRLYMMNVLGSVWREMDKKTKEKVSKFLGSETPITLKNDFIGAVIKVSSEGRVTRYNSGEVYAAIEVSGPVSVRLEGQEGEREHPVFNGRIVQVNEETGQKEPVKMHIIDGSYNYKDIATTIDGKGAYKEDGKVDLSAAGKIFGISQSWGIGTIKTSNNNQLKFSLDVNEETRSTSPNSREEFKDFIKNGKWGMLTAENPDAIKVDDETNRLNNERAKQWLRDKNYSFTDIKGKYGNEEDSILVYGLTRDDAFNFSKEFSQDSVATDEGLIYKDGSINKRAKGEEDFGGDYEDYFSTIEIQGEPFNFSVGYEEKRGALNTPTLEPMNNENSKLYPFMTEDDEGNFVFNHWSSKQFDTVTPGESGTSFTTNGESGAWSKVGGVSYFYTKNGDAEEKLTGDYGYQIKVPKEEVYDIEADRESLEKEAYDMFLKSGNTAAWDRNHKTAFISKVALTKGYTMTVSEWEGKARAHSLIPQIPSDTYINKGGKEIKKFDKEYESNLTKGITQNRLQNYPVSMSGWYLMLSDLDAKFKGKFYNGSLSMDRMNPQKVFSIVENSTLPNDEKVNIFLFGSKVWKRAPEYLPDNIKEQIIQRLIDNSDIEYTCE